MTQINHENKNHVETLQNIGRYYNINDNKGVNHHTMSNSMSIETVSYTHLDVYKRQVLIGSVITGDYCT